MSEEQGRGGERPEAGGPVGRALLEGRAALGGRRALVLGGSGGIGRATALALARRGAEIVLLGGRSGVRMEECLRELRALGVRAEGRLFDFEGLVGAPFEIGALLGPRPDFDILVAAFGPFLQAPLAETGAADWLRMATLDLALPGAFASALLPAMRSRGWGRILFFGGTGTDSLRGYRSNAAYAAAKTGLGVLAKSIALQHGEEGVAAFVLCPGLVDTEYLDEKGRQALRSRAPRGELLAASDLGETAAALLAAEPCLASGAVLSLDAGLSFAR